MQHFLVSADGGGVRSKPSNPHWLRVCIIIIITVIPITTVPNVVVVVVVAVGRSFPGSLDL